MKRALSILALIIAGIGLTLWLGGTRWLVVHQARGRAEPEQVAPPRGVAVLRDIVFAHTKDGPLRLDLYTPDPRPPGRLPVIVYVFGGGWFVGNKNQIQLVDGPLLARQGYAVVATTYRLSDVATFPAQIHDVKASIRWVRANADRYGFDPTAIGAWGSSAGGHLVALLATTSGVTELEGDVGGESLQGHSSEVQAVVDFFGPTDLARFGGSLGHLAWMVEDLLGGPLDEREALAQLANPSNHVSPGTAPLLIVHGDQDTVVPLKQSTTFHARLQAAGAESMLLVIPGGEHGGEAFQAPRNRSRVEAFFAEHLKRARNSQPASNRASPPVSP